MGWCSRTTTPKIPRWGFRIGWEDFIVAVRTVARSYGLTIADAAFSGDGVVALPEDAAYEAVDLRPIAAACHDLDPPRWDEVIREGFRRMYGRAGDIEVLEDAREAPPPMRAAPAAVTATTLHERLRVQVFGAAYLAPLARDQIALRPLGDAFAVLTQDFAGSAESTLTWAELAAAGIDVDAAFSRGRENGVQATIDDIQAFGATLPHATAEIFVSNRFYLSAVILESHARMPPGTPVIACPISWHHWVMATLGEELTRARLAETIAALRALVDSLLAAVNVPASEWIGTSLWWWPAGQAPDVIAVDGELPATLAARCAP